jgi:hypothetical protein
MDVISGHLFRLSKIIPLTIINPNQPMKMKTILFSAISTLIFFNLAAQPLVRPTAGTLSSGNAGNIDDQWLSAARQAINEKAYAFKQDAVCGSTYYAGNGQQGICFTIEEKGYHVAPLNHSPNVLKTPWTMDLAFSAIQRRGQCLLADQPVAISRQPSRLAYQYPGFTIEYLHSVQGLRQNFIVADKLAGTDKLELILKIKGNLTASVSHNTLSFSDNKEITRLFYKDLKVWDATGRELQAHMELRSHNELAIVVKDQEAIYPVTIDPVTQTPEWTTSAAGILPALIGQLAIDAAYGFTVAGLGDVNADGFDDVAVGAPAMVDLISGTGTLANVGAVFVYYGSAAGLPVVPNVILQPTTAVAGALFGFSIAGGDINNDGKADIIIGAPMDNITITTGGGGTASGQAGKVYVYNGAGLATGTSPLLSLQLSGSGILENGINLSVKALFGFSVAITEDLNGDGKKDMLVGAPAYTGVTTGLFGVHLADVQSGGAFLFLTNISNNAVTLTKLEPAKTSLLGLGLLESNITGLLFGYSVDGLGDYNGDGKADIVVSAPAGVDLSSLSLLLNGKILQGSAGIFYGTGSGITTTAGTTLTAAGGSLLSNLVGTVGNTANLFGYCVKGARSATGARNGNVLVGAPLGGALTSVLGLQLKTGTVSLFKNNASAPGGLVAPDQVISSPRNDNTILGLIQSNLLFGFSLDNALDVNCDGFSDIIVGEPASSGLQLLNTSIAGGAAYVYLGKVDGTYQASPSWTLTAYEDALLGVNATSLIGYSVANAGRIRGSGQHNRLLVGSPSRSLDFGAGLLNLGSTVGTLFSLVAGNNGAGKAYSFDVDLCSGNLPVTLTGLKGQYTVNGSLLTWQTLQEINSERFEIERKDRSGSFRYIGRVAASVHSNNLKSYQFTDPGAAAGPNYYRLKLVESNGATMYSNTIYLDVPAAKRPVVSFSPNPFRDQIQVKFTSTWNELATVNLFNNTGKLVSSRQVNVHSGSNEIRLDKLVGMAKGFYTIALTVNGITTTQKLIRQ